MKFIIVLALVMLVSFSMEVRLRSKSKSKQLDSKFINVPLYIKSAHGGYLAAYGNYGVMICGSHCDKNARTWTIESASNGGYNVVSSNGKCLCIRGNDPALCNFGDPDNNLKLIPVSSNSVGLQGTSGKYLRAGLVLTLNTS